MSLRSFNTLSIKIQISCIFVGLFLVALSCMLMLTLHLQKKQIISMTTLQLQDSARDVLEKASILRSTVDTRQYESKLVYYLGKQRSEYLARGYHLNQCVISPSAKTKIYGDMNQIPLAAQQRAQIFKKKQGIIYSKYNNQDYAIAYEYNLEDKTAFLLVLPAADYLKPVNALKNNIIVLSMSIMLLALLIVLQISKYLVRPIHGLVEAAEEVEAGILRSPSFSQGMASELTTLARSFSSMVDTQKKFVTSLKEVVMRLNQASDELSQSSLEVKEESKSISAQLEKINQQVDEQMNSMEKIRYSVEHLLDATSSINNMNKLSINISKQICKQSKEGKSFMQKVTQQITGVHESTRVTQSALQNLNQRVEEIAAFNASVETIAREIKLLAFNATIEAARAGQTGNSFGVVAHEVSKLSQETYRFSQETAKIIEIMLKDFIALKSSFQNVFDQAEASSELIQISEEIFVNIHDKTNENSCAINDVARQSQAISEQINRLAFEARKIYENSVLVSQSIPAMLSSAVNQTQSTDNSMQNSLELVGLAGQLTELVGSYSV